MSDVQLWNSECGSLAVLDRGSGPPVVFLHEFGSDMHGWQGQVEHLQPRYRCVSFNSRGYPPSTIPDDPAAFTQVGLLADLQSIVDRVGAPVNVVGISMGALTALLFALAQPTSCRSLVLTSIGTGMVAATQDSARQKIRNMADMFENAGSATAAQGAERFAGLTLRQKKPEAWERFVAALSNFPNRAAAATLRGVQLTRPTLDELLPLIRELRVPTLVAAGDKDPECLAAAASLHQWIADCELAVFPGTGHLPTLEEPEIYNRMLECFLDRNNKQ